MIADDRVRPEVCFVGFTQAYCFLMEFRDCVLLSWNISGALSKKGQCHTRELVRKVKPTVVCLMETHCSFFQNF